jgi:hypothetical protein
MDYLGVKRRTFEREIRPRLRAVRMGTSLMFDVQDLDRLFDELMQSTAARCCDGTVPATAQNQRWNGRPVAMKGVNTWAEPHGTSTPTKAVPGRSTSTGEALDFASAVSTVP